MSESDILLTVAELAVAFGGFATLAGILGKPRSKDAAYMNAARLRGMLESALLALAFSLAPFVPFLFDLDESTSWRIAAVAFLAASCLRLVSLFRRFASIRSAGASIGWLTLVMAVQILSIFLYRGLLMARERRNIAPAHLSSVCSTVLAIDVASLAWRSGAQRRNSRETREYLSAPVFSALMIFGLFVLLCQILPALGLGISQSVWWYLVGLTWILMSASYMFYIAVRRWVQALKKLPHASGRKPEPWNSGESTAIYEVGILKSRCKRAICP